MKKARSNIEFLEGLVGQRFNMQSLNDKLEKVIQTKS